LDVFVGTHGSFDGALDVDSNLRLLDGKWTSTFCWSDQQILNLLHVDFDHLDGDFESHVGINLFSHLDEELCGGHRDDTWVTLVAEDGERLARTSLSVCEDRIVDTFPSFFQDTST